MARHPRLIVPGVAMHVRQRGNNRQDVFFQDNDRLVYLSILRDLARLRQCALHAYCLMTNHIHLLVTPADEEGPSLMMRDLARCYASYFNRRYSRTGQLWEGRFRSCLVDSAAYVIGCCRYIELNPVRAHMVSSPAEHAWSSYAGNAALHPDPLLTPHEEYVALGRHDEGNPRGDGERLRARGRKSAVYARGPRRAARARSAGPALEWRRSASSDAARSLTE